MCCADLSKAFNTVNSSLLLERLRDVAAGPVSFSVYTNDFESSVIECKVHQDAEGPVLYCGELPSFLDALQSCTY